MVSDETLYRRYTHGDEDALRELMERHGDALTLYITGIIHDPHDAEDLMLDAFVRLITKKPRIWDGCFKAYLFKTARNLALRFASKLRRGVVFSLEEIEYEPDSEALVESVIEGREHSRVLRVCMEKLHSDYGEALFLLYLEGLSCREAAEVMGKSEKQVTDLAYRGKQALRRLLEEEGITDAYCG